MSLKIGLIGLDTSHVLGFAEHLNDATKPGHVPGAAVVAGFPGGSPDLALSSGRVDGFTKRLRDEFGVQILPSAAAVAEQVDLVFISAVDGRAHRRLFEEIVRFKKPTFIDKPFTTSLADAQAIMALAQKNGVPVMSSSSLRYAEDFQAALRSDADQGRLIGIDTFGPLPLEPAMPGLFWYGIHCVEIMVAALGVGCRRVQAVATDDYDLITAEWSDGRSAVCHGVRRAHWKFGAALHREKSARVVNFAGAKRSESSYLVEAILRSLSQGKSDVPAEETLEVVRFIEAANQSRATGQPVDL